MTVLRCTKCGGVIDDWPDDVDHVIGLDPYHERCCPKCHPDEPG